MSTATKISLEQRVAALEEEVAQLKAGSKKDWQRIVGTFANDPIYAEAMRLGRQWRESQRPHGSKKRKEARSRKS